MLSRRKAASDLGEEVSALEGADLGEEVSALEGADLGEEVSALEGADLGEEMSALEGADFGVGEAFCGVAADASFWGTRLDSSVIE